MTDKELKTIMETDFATSIEFRVNYPDGKTIEISGCQPNIWTEMGFEQNYGEVVFEGKKKSTVFPQRCIVSLHFVLNEVSITSKDKGK